MLHRLIGSPSGHFNCRRFSPGFRPNHRVSAPAAATIRVAPQTQLVTGGTPRVIVTVT